MAVFHMSGIERLCWGLELCRHLLSVGPGTVNHDTLYFCHLFSGRDVDVT